MEKFIIGIWIFSGILSLALVVTMIWGGIELVQWVTTK